MVVSNWRRLDLVLCRSVRVLGRHLYRRRSSPETQIGFDGSVDMVAVRDDMLASCQELGLAAW